MNECAFFDDEQPTDGLPRWATITQVSIFLAVPRTTVRDTVRRALYDNEPWVKKEDSDGKLLYLIDTTHETYKSHEQRWKHNQATRGEDLNASRASWSNAAQPFFSHFRPEDVPIPPYASSSPLSQFFWQRQGSLDDVLHRWPLFRQQLYSWGIQVFTNILAEDGQENPWQWRWENLHGEGYSSDEEAIIAALQMRLDTYKEEDEEETAQVDTSAFPTHPQKAPHPLRRLWFFDRCNGSGLFS
jgi:hypothetical protein